MSHLENFDKFQIETGNIWHCERSYFFDEKKQYDSEFALKLLNKLQFIIIQNCAPNFGEEMKKSSPDYYYRNYDEYFKSQGNLKEQFAINYFFIGDKCFTYDNQIEITPENNDDYLYWFILKLRQYDLNLKFISAFLDFQQKQYFPKKDIEFVELVKLGLKQFPELITERVKEIVIEWTNKNRNPISIKGKKTTVPKLLKWMESDAALKNAQLSYLCSELIDKFLIDKISLKNFKGHFNAENNLTPINWKDEQYPLIYFIDQLKTFLHSDILTNNSETVSINTFARHFTWKNQNIIESNWRKYKSEGGRNSKAIFDRIDQIIKGIPSKK